jgi:hypothetical protein
MSSSSSTLFSTLVNSCEKAEFPVCKIVEIKVEWNLGDSGIENRHVRLELPERIDEENGVVPSVLASGITRTSCFRANILTNRGSYGWVLHNSAVRDQRQGEVGMELRGDDGPSWNFLFRLLKVSTVLLQKKM